MVIVVLRQHLEDRHVRLLRRGRQLILGGEGAAGQMDIFLTAKLFWTIPPNTPLDDETSHRVLRNITAALQWAGYKVGFFSLD
jgi:hypothetical protein